MLRRVPLPVLVAALGILVSGCTVADDGPTVAGQPATVHGTIVMESAQVEQLGGGACTAPGIDLLTIDGPDGSEVATTRLTTTGVSHGDQECEWTFEARVRREDGQYVAHVGEGDFPFGLADARGLRFELR